MKRLIAIVRHHCNNNDDEGQKIKYHDAAELLMKARGYVEYINKHGYHFTPKLAELASKMMKNVDGTAHRWTCEEVNTHVASIPERSTLGDLTYTANMAYADFYPRVLKTENDCLQYAIAIANDTDGYEGMAFCRWTADLIGKGATIDWEKLE